MLHTSLQLDFVQSVASTMKVLMMEFLPLMLELRRELDVGGNYDDFKDLLETQGRRMQGMLDSVVADLQPR